MKKRGNIAVMARLVGLVKPLAGFMALAIFMGLVGHLCASFITIFGGFALLDILDYSLPVTMMAAFIGMGACALLRGVLRYAEQACNHFIAFKLLALIRDKVFQALRRLCPAKLEGRDRGDLIAIITSDIELLEVFYAHTISPAAIAVLYTLALCLFIGSFHWALGLLALAAYLAVGLLVPTVTSKMSGEDGMRFRAASGALAGFVLDSLRGLSETLQYGAGAERLKQMNQRTEALAQDEERMKKTAGRNMALTHTVILIFDLSMLLAAALLYQKGIVGFDGVVLPFIALMSSFGPVTALANLGSTLQNTLAAGDRVLDILDETPQVEEVSGRPPVAFDGASCEDVSFSYGDEAILEHLDLRIPAGKVLGISGRSGSGKSTLLRLLMRFWDVQGGAVRISGTDLRQIDTANLRRMEGFVTQETHLFHDSIAANLKIAKPDATREELVEACKKASLHDFIETLPQGYDTPVGELGDTLSGGERQRLGLARAFLHGAPLLLLDEPTSNLDSLNEAVILRAIRQERGGRTVVLVSHRASTMAVADEVYSAERGRAS